MNTLRHIVPFWFALLLLVLVSPTSLAQAPPDSTFFPEGIEATGDTAEVRALTTWANEHRETKPEQAQQAAESALTLARELDDQRGIGESLLTPGNLAVDSNLSQAETYYTEAQEAFEEVGDVRGLIRSRQLHMGIVYSRRGELERALTAYFNALESFKRLGDAEGQATVLNSIGATYQIQGNLEGALSYYKRAVAQAETLDEPALLVKILFNFGGALAIHGSYEKAETTLRRALAISEEQGFRDYMAAAANNLGYLFNKLGRHEQALSFLSTAERLANELDEDELLFAVYDELGKAYMGFGQYVRALHYANESLVLAREAESLSFQMDAHQTLTQIYEAAGDNGQALSHHRQYAAARDSFLNVRNAEVIAEVQTRYETEQKQLAIQRLEQENRIQALQLSLLLAGVGGLLLILSVLLYRYRVKRKANRLLEELDAAKSRFFANISHEFRTPLTVILGGMQDMIAGRFDENEEKLSEQQHVVLRNTHQLQQLVDEVLDLNRLEAGKLALEPTPGDLVQFLRRLVEASAPLAERNGIALAFDSVSEHCPRLYDEDKLEKIVGNLISNALKFIPKGGSVQVGLRGGEETEISVSDNGPGIPAEAKENVFERFAQVEDGSQHGGTGIGLALAKELAELHGGTIALESTPGEGSTFTVRLPLQEVALDDVLAPKSRAGLSSVDAVPPEEIAIGGDGATVALQGHGDADRTTVLVIEDNADVRAYVRRSLEKVYRVIEAADGETGLQQARSELPDLIVSDVMLPGIDGYEIARRLKAESDTECIPVVMLTARAAEEDQTEGYGSGAEVYITKPFAPETLRAAIARLLEERLRLWQRLREEAENDAVEGQKIDDSSFRARARSVLFGHLFDEDFGVRELASALGMSRRTLHRRTKQEVGLSPSDFLRTFRLERARQLLSSGTGTVSEVAYAVGFNSLVAFSRAYRSHFGVPPSSHLGKEYEMGNAAEA